MTSRHTFYLIIGVLCITLVIGIIAFQTLIVKVFYNFPQKNSLERVNML